MKKQGFSLFEVLASFVIVGVALVGVMKMFSMASTVGVFKKDAIMVSNLMQRKIEEIKCKKFSVDVSESGTVYAGFPSHSFDVTQTINYLSNPFLKRVSVTVLWNDPSGIVQQETIPFFVADH